MGVNELHVVRQLLLMLPNTPKVGLLNPSHPFVVLFMLAQILCLQNCLRRAYILQWL